MTRKGQTRACRDACLEGFIGPERMPRADALSSPKEGSPKDGGCAPTDSHLDRDWLMLIVETLAPRRRAGGW